MLSKLYPTLTNFTILRPTAKHIKPPAKALLWGGGEEEILKVKIEFSKRVGKRLMGGQNVSCDFLGGKRTIECPLQQKVGFAWSVPVSSKENNRAKTNGGWENVS